MPQTPAPSKSRAYLRATGLISMIAGILVLMGWLLDMPLLAQWHPSFVMMKANPSLALALLGLAAWFLGSPGPLRPFQIHIIRSGAALVGILGILTALEVFFGWNFGIDEVLSRDNLSSSQTNSPGRMSINTAICFALLGAAIPLLTSRLRLRYWISQSLTSLSGIIALMAFVGHLYGANFLIRDGMVTSIAPHTAVLLLLLSLAFTAASPTEGFMAALNRPGAGSYVFRRQIAWVVAFTVISGSLSLWGAEQGFYLPRTGTLLHVVLLVSAFTILSWRNADFMNYQEKERNRLEALEAQKRKEAEQKHQALKESEENLNFALDAGRIGIMKWDIASGAIRLSPIGLRLLGCWDAQSSFSFADFETSIYPGDKPGFKSAVEAAVRDRDSFKQDFRIIGSDGTVRWLHGRGKATYDESGAAKSFSLALVDITHRKSQERQLTEILESITSGFMALDRDWRFSYINATGARLVGKPVEQLIGKDLRDVFPEAIGTPFEQHYKAGLERGTRSKFEAYYAPLKTWYEVTVYPAENGISIYFDDINARKQAELDLQIRTAERRQAEERLLRSESKFRRLVESNILGIFTYNLDGRITEANGAFLRILGYSPVDLQSGRLRWRDLTPPEWVPRDGQAAQELIDRGTMDPYEKEFVRKDGSRARVFIGAANFEDSRREGIAYVLDITERYQADQRIRDLLESERELRQKAEQATRARDDVVAMVSHDLKNPIGAILLNAQLLSRRPSAPEEVKKRAQSIIKAGQRMEGMVKNILDVAKLESGTFTLDLYPEEVSDICREASEMLTPLAAARQIGLTTKLPTDCCPKVAADRERIIQVLSNLVGNALKFTPRGGKVTIAAERAPDGVLFSVTDTGPGIPPNEQERIFDRFWQANAGRRRGTGLGLAIVKGIIEGHGGKAWAEKKPEAGATIHFTLLRPEALPERLRTQLRSERAA